MIEWDDNLSLGVGEIDEDHKHLVRVYNQLFDARLGGLGTAAVHALLHDLVANTRTHFQREEALMEDVAFPGLRRHKDEHDGLLKTVLDIQGRAVSDAAHAISDDTLVILKSWLLNHMQGSDKIFAYFLSSTALSR